MTEYQFQTVDVFTDRRFGGNPLAVFPNAAGLPDTDMQALAREFNLSETTFVLPPADPAHTARVRIFTPACELGFAGHPNVGTALVLAAMLPERPDTMVFEETAGLVRLRFDWTGPAPLATLEAPQPLSLGTELPADLVAACAGLTVGEVLTARHQPRMAGVGTSFALAEVTAEALARAVPDTAAMHRAAARFPVRPIGFPLLIYVHEGSALRMRMFSPLSGIPEDPATGSAAVALAALLLHLDGADRGTWVVHQGAEMGRPSLLHASAYRAADGVRAQVGGGAVPVLRGSVMI